MINPIFSAGIGAALGPMFKCPKCGHEQRARKSVGRILRCSKCRHPFTHEQPTSKPNRRR